MCFATSGCSCARSSMRFLISGCSALEWLLHCRDPGCHVRRFVSRFYPILALVIFLLNIILQSASKFLQHFFLCFGGEIRFGAAIADAVACSSFVFCNSVAADRIVVAASRLLCAAAACVILLSFAAEHRKSYWGGCIQAAIAICRHIF